MALVYSYIRFSTRKQMVGGSLRRQLDLCEEWINRHGHTPASLTLHDLGIPSFRGQNKHKGALGEFLKAIEAKTVKAGSVLLVENLDRLSREGVGEAFDLFRRILKAGVSIAVLKPYETVYTKESLNDIIGLLIPLMYFHLAYIESKNKSDRLAKYQEQRRQDVNNGKVKVFSKRRPCWVDWDEKKGEFVLNDGWKAIHFIFSKTAEGEGQRQVLRMLQEKFPPIGKSGQWNLSFVVKVLSDRSVLGEHQRMKFDENGERHPVGKPIPNYYPPIPGIEELWDRAQMGKRRRTKHKGPNGKYVNLFTALVTNAHDGSVMHVQTTGAGTPNEQRRLVSYNHTRKVSGADSVSVDVGEFETSILRALTEIKPSDLMANQDTARERLREKQDALGSVNLRLDELSAVMANPENKNLSAVVTAAAELEKRKLVLLSEIESLGEEVNAEEPLTRTHSLLAMLENAPENERHGLRLRLRAEIARVVKQIYLKPEKHYGRVWFLAHIWFNHGDMMKSVLWGPGASSFTPEQCSISEFNIDLRDRAQCQKPVLAKLAKAIMEPAEVPIPSTVPDKLSDAGEVWLLVAKSSMGADSFRVVPSKVRRFVEVVGSDLLCASLSGSHWRRWTRWLEGEVAAGRMAATSAKVNYNRAGEFVRWLKGKGAADVGHIPHWRRSPVPS